MLSLSFAEPYAGQAICNSYTRFSCEQQAHHKVGVEVGRPLWRADYAFIHSAAAELLQAAGAAEHNGNNQGLYFNCPRLQLLQYWAVAVLLQLHQAVAHLTHILLHTAEK